MDCDRVQEHLQALVDGELDAADTTLARRHVRACGECGADVGSLEATLRTLGAARDVDVPAGLAAGIVDSIWERAALPPPRRTRIAPIAWFLVGAATAAAAAFLLFAAWGTSHDVAAPRIDGVPSPVVQVAAPPNDDSEPVLIENSKPDSVADAEPWEWGDADSTFVPREVESPVVLIPEPDAPQSLARLEPTWSDVRIVRPPAPSFQSCESAPPTAEVEANSVTLVVHDDGSVEVEMRGPLADRIPVLVSLLGDRDRRVQIVAQQELARISHELVSTGVLPQRSLDTLATTAAPRPNVIDRLRGRVPEAPATSSEERWTSWWEQHRDAIAAMPDNSTSMSGGL
ncbi:MAG: zf-HC2 domain-containing protein [Planctomycetes bacterium]|nr:zf-HC2 domain-containing protein [Planctomycetota bacterium]MBI3845941.1 zf-HC2 domain-containing protein [Planctomycetota bacterium]